MRKAKYNEVPKEYRRNYKKEFVEFIGVLAASFGFALFIMWIVHMA